MNILNLPPDDYADLLLKARERYRSNENLRAIYREVWLGKGNHGSWLRSFAECVARADAENFELLKVTAVWFAVKYDLLPK